MMEILNVGVHVLRSSTDTMNETCVNETPRTGLDSMVSMVRSKISQNALGSLSSQPTEMLSERVTRSTVGQRNSCRFASGSIPNRGNFRRRQLLDGAVRTRDMPDTEHYMSARERYGADSESDAKLE